MRSPPPSNGSFGKFKHVKEWSDDVSIQERLREAANGLSQRTAEYVDHHQVSPCDGEALDAAQEMGEAADVIDEMANALEEIVRESDELCVLNIPLARAVLGKLKTSE